jgi:zinc protease
MAYDFTNGTVQPSSSPNATDTRSLFTLDNGLRVVVQEDHFAPVVAIQVWVKAGSADETPDVAGAAHVHEHMIFKGTARRPVGAIAAEVESSGGNINAFTSADHTVYHVVLASRYCRTGLDILSDAMLNTTFDPHELEKELQVVMEEWKRGEDSPTSRAATELFRLAYTTHPYGRPVIGFRETVEALNRERVVNFYQRWYHPNNMTLVIVGDIDREVVRRNVTELFGARETVELPVRPRTAEPPQKELRLSAIDMNIEEFYLYLGYPIPPADHPDVFALDLLSFILGGGESARLVQTVQAEKELVNWISASAYTPEDAGLFILAAALEQEKISPAWKRCLLLLCSASMNASPQQNSHGRRPTWPAISPIGAKQSKDKPDNMAIF